MTFRHPTLVQLTFRHLTFSFKWLVAQCLSAKCQGTVLKSKSFIQLTPSQRSAHLGPLVPDDVELPAVGMATVEHRVVDELGHAGLVAKETAALFRNIAKNKEQARF